jgi:8-oxo-dGTP diphosphatase
MSYCPRCGHELSEREVYGRLRLVCPHCEFVLFRGPKVAVGVLAARAGRLLLTRRNIDPGMGKWGFPAGYMDIEETTEETARREFKEETGFDVRLDGLVGVYSHVERGVLLVAYAGTIVGGALAMDHETQAVDYFAPSNLPELAFAENRAVIADWQHFLASRQDLQAPRAESNRSDRLPEHHSAKPLPREVP